MRCCLVAIGVFACALTLFASADVQSDRLVSTKVEPTTQATTKSAWPFELTILRPVAATSRWADRDRLRFIVEARGDAQFRDPPFDGARWTREHELESFLRDHAADARKADPTLPKRLILIVYGNEATTRSGPDWIETTTLDEGRTLLILCNPTYHFGSARVLYVVGGEVIAEQHVLP
jgi:hypothetical protein